MLRLLLSGFLIAHGGVHVAMWATPRPKDGSVPFDPSTSWLLGSQRGLAIGLALVATALLASAGIALWIHAPWWRPVAAAGLVTSFGLMVVYFNPWFLFIEAVNLALIVALLWLDWPSRSVVAA